MSYFNKFPRVEYDFFKNNQMTLIPDIFRQVRIINKRFESATPYQVYEIKDERPDQLSFKLYGKVAYHWTFFIINDTLSNGLEGWPMTYIQLQNHISHAYKNHTITLFRGKDEPLNSNSIAGKFRDGTILTGVTSGRKATVLSRNPEVNQLIIKFDDKPFNPGESIAGNDGTSILSNYEIRDHKNSVRYYVDEDGNKISNVENLYITGSSLITNAEHERIINDDRRFIRVLRPEFIEEFATEYRRLLNVS